MTPVQSFAAKRQRVKQAMEDLGFMDLHVEQILQGLRPGNIDEVIATLEEYEREDYEG